jgi:hypothetical protein
MEWEKGMGLTFEQDIRRSRDEGNCALGHGYAKLCKYAFKIRAGKCERGHPFRDPQL